MKPIKLNLHKIAIVGRPNVGKSTLFNRVLNKRKAVVEDKEFTTRDRISGIVEWEGKYFELIDTAGMDFGKKEKISELIEKQIYYAINEADQIIFLCDGKTGAMQLDHKVCDLLRKSSKKITIAANKMDNPPAAENISDFYKFGFGVPLAISALHGKGVAELLDILTANMRDESTARMSKNVTKIAIVGKPNAGKSSLLNYLLDEERVVVSPEPGTTRDSVDVYFKKDRDSFIIIDTAGIRSKSKIKDAVTYFSILRAEESVQKSDVVIILLDGPTGVTKEDSRIINLVQERQRPFILTVNKWDLGRKEGANMAEFEKAIRQGVKFIYNAPIIFISALTGENAARVLDLCRGLSEKSKKNISTSELNKILKDISFHITRLYSIRQIKNAPPEFEITAKRPDLIDEANKRYLINILRKKLGLEGIPVIIKFKRKFS
ncbi:MAG: ribosome biogenesis GTPase Der [Candidatus Omnitrophota bacterium]